MRKGIAGAKVAYSETLGLADLVIAPDVLDRLRVAARILEGLGAHVETAHPPAVQQSVGNHGAMWTSFSALLEQSLGARAAELDKSLREYADIGKSLPREAFLNAVVGRGEVGREINAFFDRYEFLVCPVFPSVARTIDQTLKDELPMPGLTCWVNQCGLLGASVYCGLGSGGLPVGLHIIGRQYQDARVLAAAAAFETAFGRATYPI